MSDVPKLVRVEWIDAFAGMGWAATFNPPTEVLTVGWLAAEELDYVVVCTSWDPDTGEFNACMTIPRVCVSSIKEIQSVSSIKEIQNVSSINGP